MERTAQPTVAGGQRLRLRLQGMGRLGECLASYEGMPVYVFGGIPGEEVVVEVVRRRRRSLVARVVEVVEPSPQRVTPPCPYFWPCTGCQWQHIRYQHQLALKRQRVAEALGRIPALAGVPILPTLPAPRPYAYRNHARFTIGPRGTLGFVNRTTREFVVIQECLLMHPWINQAVRHLQGQCAETTQLSIRYGVNTGTWLIQPRLHNPAIALATGQPAYQEALLGRRFRVASPSFFQVNTAQAERLVEHVRQRLHLTGQEFLVDAYAGVGTFAVLLAPWVRRVVAIEESASAVQDAQANAQGLPHVEFRQGKTEEVLGELEERPDVVLLDPPRTGCHPKALEALSRLAPPQVVYISCEPETLARDLERLAAGPFHVVEVQPVDMFPQTHHIECVALLRLRDATTPRLTLASASPRRRQLLRELGLPFQVVPPPEGTEGGEDGTPPPEVIAQGRALRKARAVAQQVGGLVLGADTVVALEGRILGKPTSPQEAISMLQALRGRTHRVITGVALVDPATGREATEATTTLVHMRPYTDEEITAYVATGDPMDKAGAYAVQDPTFRPAQRVEGCSCNVVGLPLGTVARLLAGFGVAVTPPGGEKTPQECPFCTPGAGERERRL